MNCHLFEMFFHYFYVFLLYFWIRHVYWFCSWVGFLSYQWRSHNKDLNCANLFKKIDFSNIFLTYLAVRREQFFKMFCFDLNKSMTREELKGVLLLWQDKSWWFDDFASTDFCASLCYFTLTAYDGRKRRMHVLAFSWSVAR